MGWRWKHNQKVVERIVEVETTEEALAQRIRKLTEEECMNIIEEYRKVVNAKKEK